MKHVFSSIRTGAFCASAIVVGVLAGCSPSAPETKPAPSGEPTAAKEFKGKLEVAAFQGGYRIDFYQESAKEFAAKHSGLEIKVEGSPRIWEQLRPRFVGGNPPDLVFPGWGMDHWALAEEGQLVDLTEAMKSKAYGSDLAWGDTFDPAMLKLGQLEGKQYVLPYYFSMHGWWYDPGLFAKNGWTAPKNWDELLALCEKIKDKGIAPITYQGKYPYYMIDGMLLPWALSVGGADVIKACQNLEPGAWKNPAIVKAASMIKELKDKGYFQSGATAMSHTESQQEFLQGKAAMIPCGTWLYSEMKNVMPKGAQMEFLLPPVAVGGKGDPTSVIVGIEPWMVPTASKQQDAAIELFKYMTSLDKAKQFVEAKGTLTAIKGSDDAKLPPVLEVPAKIFRASKNVWAVQYRAWYPAFGTEIENSITALVNGELTPEAFADRVEAAAEKTRKDDSISKHKVQ